MFNLKSMKTLLIICGILFVNIIQAQEIKTYKLLPPESKEYTDRTLTANLIVDY